MTDAAEFNPYEPPRSSLTEPPAVEPGADHWPILIKVLAGLIIAECGMYVITPMIEAGGPAWPDFGHLIVSLGVLFSVYKRNRWGWILAVAVPVTITPVILGLVVSDVDWDAVLSMLDLSSRWYFLALGIPAAGAFVLLFVPTTIRWYFGKHSQRNKVVTAFIWCVVMTGHVVTVYGSYLSASEALATEYVIVPAGEIGE